LGAREKDRVPVPTRPAKRSVMPCHSCMATISLELPDALAKALKAAEAETGADGRELAVAALREFLAERRLF
ncbi:MAG: hypothetical protein NWQ95_05500, partial [Verrucomicrobiales bacterium]|nr:hypothetical protein [Verrucomicrobiales bacterium]